MSPFPIIIDCQFRNRLISKREANDRLSIIIDDRPNTRCYSTDKMFIAAALLVFNSEIYPGPDKKYFLSNKYLFARLIQANLDMTDHCTTDFCL